MNIWENAVITDKGLSLQSKLTQGHTLKITRAVTGSGYVTAGLLHKQTAVADEQQTLEFKTASYPEAGKCAVLVALTNDGLAAGYKVMQVGFYAEDPDEGEILYFIAQAPDQSDGTNVPSESEMPGYSAEWTFYFQYGQADGVAVTVDPSNTVSREEMETYIGDEFVRITETEIDAAFGTIGGGDISGDTGGGEAGTGGTYTLDHNALYNRDAANQHTIGAITGLQDALAAAEGNELDSQSVEDAWTVATEE